MPCPDSGQIKISDLVAEFGGSAPHAMSEYYRNGANVPGNNTNVATSGQISLTQFYAAVNEIIFTHTSGGTHFNYATVFGSNWASSVPKRIVVNSGVTVGGTSDHAMTLPSGMGGTLVIDNNGSIEVYLTRGSLKQKTGDLEGAIEDYSQAIMVYTSGEIGNKNKGIATRTSFSITE